MNEQRRALNTTEMEKLGHWAKGVWKDHGLKLGIAGGVTLVAVLGYLIYNSSSKAARAEQWQQVVLARSAQQYGDLADTLPESAAAEWSRLKHAEGVLADAIPNTFINRAAAKTELHNAQESLEKLVASSKNPKLRQRAYFSLGRLQELTNQPEEAIETYQTLLKEYPETPYKSVVDGAITKLEQDDVREFYAWFDKQDPKPGDIQLPADGGTAPGQPGFNPIPPRDSGPPPELPPLPDVLRPEGLGLGSSTDASTEGGTTDAGPVLVAPSGNDDEDATTESGDDSETSAADVPDADANPDVTPAGGDGETANEASSEESTETSDNTGDSDADTASNDESE